MKKTQANWWSAAMALVCLAWAAGSAAELSDYEAALETWKGERLAYLKSANGYLNLVGLFWLRKPQNTFGSSATNDLVFPPDNPPRIGEFRVEDGRVLSRITSDIEVLYDGTPVQEIEMRDDLSGDPVVVTHGSLAWTVIRRDQQFAVRVRDFAHPAIESFPDIEYFPTDESFRVVAELQPYEVPRQVRVNTVIEGLEYKPQSPGTVRFDLHGESYELEAYGTGNGLMFVFGDRTTGRQTYPAGRFLYTATPDKNGLVVLDFNRAENPPCAFNEFATCPVASPRNRLAVMIPAGERFDVARH